MLFRSHSSILENPMDRGAWQATVHGVTKSQTQLSDFMTQQRNYGGGNVDNDDPLQKDLCQHTAAPRTVEFSAPTSQKATVDPHLCQRLLDTHRQIWVSLLWDHSAFLLGPGAHNILFVCSRSLFPQFCGSSITKSHWPSKSNALGVLSPFAISPSWEICGGP